MEVSILVLIEFIFNDTVEVRVRDDPDHVSILVLIEFIFNNSQKKFKKQGSRPIGVSILVLIEFIFNLVGLDLEYNDPKVSILVLIEFIFNATQAFDANNID